MMRRSFRKPAVTLSLFPFLAVLVCTMGALIVLLVIVVQKAGNDAAIAVEEATVQTQSQAASLDKLREEQAEQEWRQKVLSEQRTAFQKQLVERRLSLSHLEDHIRQLDEQWKQLSAQADELARLAEDKDSQKTDHVTKLQRLRSEIAVAEQAMQNAKERAASRKRTFSIIPYAGPNGTKRRPIYLECTDEGIVLQPEGVVLTPADFSGSLGPGNPLDAALRTAREHLAGIGDTQINGEPYPLLVVRPNGTVAYAVARAALKNWDDEFGYELIDADMKLAYPKPNATMKRELERIIADARQRQVILTNIMPGRFKAGTGGLVATTNGGFAPLGGGSPSAPTPPLRPTGGSFSTAFRHELGVDDGSMTLSAAQRAAQRGASGSTLTGTRASLGGSSADPTGSGLAQNRSTAGQAEGVSSGSANTLGDASASTPAPGATAMNSPQFGSQSSSSALQLGAPSAGSNSNPSASATSQVSTQRNKSSPSAATPLAASRGAEWGLPNRAPQATGIQRYIQVQCFADKLVLLPDKEDFRAPQTIAIASETSAAVDAFVSTLWRRMESWGVAGDGCYWKPVLRVHVASGAESRYLELNTLLIGSGLVVERKN